MSEQPIVAFPFGADQGEFAYNRVFPIGGEVQDTDISRQARLRGGYQAGQDIQAGSLQEALRWDRNRRHRRGHQSRAQGYLGEDARGRGRADERACAEGPGDAEGELGGWRGETGDAVLGEILLVHRCTCTDVSCTDHPGYRCALISITQSLGSINS